MLSLLKRLWIPVVVAIVVALGAVAVTNFRAVFGSDEIFRNSGNTMETLVPTNEKTITYELFGQGSASGKVSFLDAAAELQETVFTGLPWQHSFTTTTPSVIASLVAQGDASALGCRIRVNGEVKDEQTVTAPSAQAFCLVKAA